jgi:UDP-N-acetylglucosamine acyltransferase
MASMGGLIHATALVEGSAAARNLAAGPFAILEAGAIVGDDCVLAAHAVVRSGCELGDQCTVDSFAVLGGLPQVRAAASAAGRVRIGARVQLREGVTVNRASTVDGWTRVGADCMLMANSHVAHDCVLGDRVTLANNVMLAGHVEVGDGTFVGGGAGVHQFVRIGQGVMVAGNASISYDVPPFVLVAERNEVHGLNLVGIRRSGFPIESVADLKRCYHAVYSGPGDLRERARAALADRRLGVGKPGRAFLDFFAGSRRGFVRPSPRVAVTPLTEASA